VRRERITVGHKTFSYLVAEPFGPVARQRPLTTAVFLHAFPLGASMWEPNLEGLPDGWRAIAPDLPGFGGTPLPERPGHRMADFAGDVIDLLDHLGATQAVVVGCSMGGYVAFQVMKSAPRYVIGLALVSTRAGADNEESRQNRRKMMATLDADGVGAVATEMAPKLVGATTRRQHPDLVEQVRSRILANDRIGMRTAVGAIMERDDSTALLGHIKVPTLIVHGLEDALIPFSEAESMHRVIARSEYYPVPYSGHLPNLEHAKAFNARLAHFLSRV
jgi:pimeloyl-ACP methyl ester carboxylesterase